ncbi:MULTISPECIES: hypothetical protein [Halorhodospira]|uniref:hypothetical protein n=1 Tax=Halorhodospira TaxID=85108 RepID=UPI0019140AFA|nr:MULTISPECIES: hypothetical protein [Halorhodospira]MBK5943318.1 hypothetical protein [Halorhodospira halophila]MCG5526843.1 hypothetical protein [Halorhodospira halophila]MCG5542820.1 hypothetical protein [Halorhodospira sp. 9628]
MAQYQVDWTGVPIGTTPPNIVGYYGGADQNWIVESRGSLPDGVGARPPSSSPMTHAHWVDVFPSEDQEVLTVVDYPSITPGWTECYIGVMLRSNLSGGGYHLGLYSQHVWGEDHVLRAAIGQGTTGLNIYTETVIAPSTGGLWSLRAQAQGSNLRLKVWPYETPEPAAWTLEATNSQWDAGVVGLSHRENHPYFIGPMAAGTDGDPPPAPGGPPPIPVSLQSTQITAGSARLGWELP